MRNQLIILFLLLIPATVLSQYKEATDDEKAHLLKALSEAAGNMKTLQSDFTQTKELSFMNENIRSEGKMHYKNPDKIRWEYTKPYAYTFSMDGKTVRMTAGGKTSKIPMNANKLFSEISAIMIGGINGDAVKSNDFTVSYQIGTDDDKILLIPLKKDIRNLFAEIELHIGKTDKYIRKVVMTEKSRDKTTIELKNTQLNRPIDDKIFIN